jgi:hypothetical protein
MPTFERLEREDLTVCRAMWETMRC